MNPQRSHLARVNRVIDHIEQHLTEPLDLGTLASLAHFSPWHFHRVFHAVTGETVADHVRRRRLEAAARRLLESPPSPALNIALDVGFGSAEVFTRAFRAQFGVTPSAWRHGAHSLLAQRRRAQLRKIHQADHKAHQAAIRAFRQHGRLWPAGRVDPSGGQDMDVQIRTFPDTRVAYMRNVGPYGQSGIARLWQRFAAWCESQGLMQPRRKMYGISQDNPDVTPPDKCRYDAAIAVDDGFKPQGEVGIETIAGGRYACTAFAGSSEEIHAAWLAFGTSWLPTSGYQPENRPCFELYDEDFKMDERTGRFNCWLCMPVKPA
jgi:AraC family transcriptional regulator